LSAFYAEPVKVASSAGLVYVIVV